MTTEFSGEQMMIQERLMRGVEVRRVDQDTALAWGHLVVAAVDNYLADTGDDIGVYSAPGLTDLRGEYLRAATDALVAVTAIPEPDEIDKSLLGWPEGALGAASSGEHSDLGWQEVSVVVGHGEDEFEIWAAPAGTNHDNRAFRMDSIRRRPGVEVHINQKVTHKVRGQTWEIQHGVRNARRKRPALVLRKGTQRRSLDFSSMRRSWPWRLPGF